jgi:hypothetical protein
MYAIQNLKGFNTLVCGLEAELRGTFVNFLREGYEVMNSGSDFKSVQDLPFLPEGFEPLKARRKVQPLFSKQTGYQTPEGSRNSVLFNWACKLRRLKPTAVDTCITIINYYIIRRYRR